MPNRATPVTVTRSAEIELTWTARVTPSRPPPPCSNPDSPAFSDSGDPAEVDDVRLVLTDEQRATVAKLILAHANCALGCDTEDLLVQAILSEIGVTPPDDDFIEALGDGEPDEDVMGGEDR